ncbi:hypothetical protein BDN70DRAFT_843035 [Pholiota conissans]|uniref:Uncharacterized protein n=1 Tax=Pholiota conissans TaxID=109636 RepID=A0A9P6CV74_9AGAR|nr:hypothetical protein BDN70DRAFT_843035 [Pholiota conissans]
MSLNSESIKRHFEELQLIQCSLLPTEHLTFQEDSTWKDALQKFTEDSYPDTSHLKSSPSIGIHVDDAKISFKIGTNMEPAKITFSVRGEGITRVEQERWRSLVAEVMKEISDSEYPAYQLISLHLLPLLHEEMQSAQSQILHEEVATNVATLRDNELFHVLFTSHHLISPNKRRSLQQWSSSLSLSGFAKVGYPGVIYAQGERFNVEEFVDNVKAMQWLALRVRFVEPLLLPTGGTETAPRSWKEFQKVGEVVEEMRRIGREEFVVEMGIGSAGSNNAT